MDGKEYDAALVQSQVCPVCWAGLRFGTHADSCPEGEGEKKLMRRMGLG